MNMPVKVGDRREICDLEARSLGEYEVTAVQSFPKQQMQLIRIQVPAAIAKQVAGFRVQAASVSEALKKPLCQSEKADDAMICLCERVTVGQVRELIRKGINDLNQIKAITRAGMGPCGAKTCEVLIKGLLREEGIPTTDVVPNTKRPVFIEVPLAKFPDGGK
ncbi:MAG: (2Fe-2S)-binding protein [Candidatus Cloacimonetes bacterium]|nr:(2Fe-2S)-binding protein [Candidatus Cloacimonadota bacterium]